MTKSLRSTASRLMATLMLGSASIAWSSTDFYSTGPGQGGSDTLCDVWQALFNGWGLAPTGDQDNDGCSNYIESVAGTDPRVAGDCHRVGNTVISASNVVFTFDAEAGKKYRVLSDDSPGGTFATVVTQTAPVNGQTEFMPTTDTANQTISVAKPVGSKKFYKLEVSDVDTDGDTVSDWAESRTGLDPNDSDSDNDGISDGDEVEDEVSQPDEVSILASSSSASEDGPTSGNFTVSRTRSLIGATVNFSLTGTAASPADYNASPTNSMTFAPGERSKMIHVNPETDSDLEGSESVTATLTNVTAGSYSPPVIDEDRDTATVIIGNTTAASGTGLTARYYDNSNGTYLHAANFGDSGNYAYTRNGAAGNNYAGSVVVVTPTGVDAARLAVLLNALTVNITQVKLSFNGGNLNTAAFNHLDYLVTAKTATTFTCAIPPSATLPGNSSNTCGFSIQPLHPAVIDRVDPVVNNDWMGGTPNGVAVAAAAGTTPINVPDNYSDTFETYLHPTTAGNYRFQLDADDKARVLIDLNLDGDFDLPGEQIVEHGWDTAATVAPEDGTADDEVIGTFKATPSGSPYALAVPASPAQRYKMRVEHVETTGTARCRLQWSRDGGAFGNIDQSNQFTHTQAITYAFTRGTPVTTGTATISLTAHGLSVGDPVVLDFTNGTLFTPNTIDPNGYSGAYNVATVPDANSFTVVLNSTGSTLPANQGSGATGFIENRPASTTTGVFNKTYTNTTFSNTPGRIGTNQHVTESNNGLWGEGTPDLALINADTFSVRWSGQMQPQFTEEYTIIVHADDGAMLRVNGQQYNMMTLPATQSGGSTYHYDSTTGTTIVNYMGALIRPGSVVVGETVRVDPSSGNLTHPNGSTYTYDAATGVATVDYSNLTTVTPGSYLAGQYVEVDPTAGTATSLATIRYTILSSPAPTATTFAISLGINAFASQTTPATANITDNRDALVTAVYASGTGTYSYNTTTGDTVVDYTVLGLPANSITTGMNVLVDPSSGNISGQVNAFKSVTSHTATTFTVAYPAGSGTGTGSIIIVAPSVPGFPVSQTTAFAMTLDPGRYANASIGNTNIDIVNKLLKDFASMGSERYVRLPLVGGTRYDIQLDYYESTGFSRCFLYWQSASQPKQIIPTERLYPSTVPQAPPAHVADTSANALVGGAFSYAVLGSNGATVSVSGNPAWLTYSGGVLSGTPPPGAAGSYQILISITNGAGTSTSVLNLEVEDTGSNVGREVWTGITGTSISSIPLSNTPNSTSTLTQLAAPTNAADDFGARIRGYITAPVTGNYYFWLSASDSAEFWLSNDDEVVNSFKRATVTGGGTTPLNWATAAKSPWMALVAGERYYYEILHKSATGDDHLALGWSMPGQDTTTASGVVPGYVLSPYVPPAPGSSNGTLYIATMLSQSGAITNGVGTATFRLSEDENSAIVSFDIPGFLNAPFNGLTGIMTDWHVHNDPYLTHPSSIMYDPNQPPPGSGPQPDGSHKWVIPAMVGPLTKAQVVELIKQGKSYVNIHTAAYPNGEIRGNLTLANGTKTFTPPPAPPTWTDDSNTNVGAARFLAQASYGANIADITALKGLTASSSSGLYPPSRYEAWIDNQFAIPATNSLDEVLRTRRADAQGGSQLDETLFFNSWWRNSVSGPDQLRQRIAFALSQIHVISGQGPLDNRGEAIAYFYDKLSEGAFGNFREILETTTLTPAMGRYLDMKNNDKPDPALGRIPNENYAREIKQLFSIGLYRMWPDGTLMLTSDDHPIDTYTQREIVGFAHVFTGWTDGYDGVYRTGLSAPTNWMRQMREVPARHYTGTKRVLNNEVMPGLATLNGQPLDPIATHNSTHFNQPAYQQLPVQELEASHDQLFNHPNTGPFICRQLIQRMVTSHPSRDYLYRVVQKFNNNGAGVRGDMQAVIKAILLDYEARSSYEAGRPAYGKQREPLLRVAAAGRAFRPDTYAGTYSQTEAGGRVITVNTTDGETPTPNPKPHKLADGNNVFLEFTDATTPGGPKPAPWTGTYGVVTVVDSDTFTINATNWTTGTYNIPANSTTCTVSMTNHWLQSGNKVYMDFTSGNADVITNVASVIDKQVYTISHTSTANNGDNGNSFTITVAGTDAAVRSGNCMIPRYRPGSMAIANSGLAAPNDRRVTMRTEEDHHLNVGDQVQLNVYATQATPQPVDVVVTVDTVVDLKTYTFLISSATTGWSNSQGNNSVYQFPLQALPLIRNGTINSRSSSYQIGNTDGALDQSPVNADTVFNYFLPDYKFPGSLASQGITTPEFQLTAETGVIRQANFIYDGVFNGNTTNGFSSFTTGNGHITLDYEPWMVDDATNLNLGAPSSTTLPWTHNQNITTLINQLSVLLTADKLSTDAKTIIRDLVALPISSISTGNPCTVNTLRPHGYTTGQSVCISGVTNGSFSPTVNSTSSTRVITVVDADTFTVTGVNCTAAPNASGLTNAHVSQIIYNQGSTTPSATERRDRIRAILHLILTSPDFTIQR